MSGVPIAFAKDTYGLAHGVGTASADRIDNDLSYVKGNMQWLHKWINIAKKDHTTEEFIAMCNAVAHMHPVSYDLINSDFTIKQVPTQ